MRILSPSMLAADFGNLERETKMVDRSAAQWIHIDVMDGCFVPNISFGFPVMEAIRRHSSKPLDVHLMIVEPERYVERFAKCGAEWVTFHTEATECVEECVELIHNAGAKAGVSIKPATSVESLREVITKVDMVLIMSVEPGFGGQKFIPESIARIEELRAMIIESGSTALIGVDGGIGAENAAAVYDAGADMVVAGSSVFGKQDPEAEMVKILNA